ncbi:MAG TPA: lytic transglycosylase domain-containing protein, partial [Thermoanaerobaculia bacterium]|nr:lytic transglycosylase domain-containing protein [Thermoanaerobaculia bacterium]
VPAVPYGTEIFEAARRHGVAPELVAAVVRAESAFQARAVSVKGASGLMQLMPATARRFGVGADRIFDPQANVDAGVRYLAWLLERFENDLSLALAAYNAGEGTVDRYGGVPPFRETRGYIARIFTTLGLAHTPTQIASSL